MISRQGCPLSDAAMSTIIRQIRRELKANADPRTKATGRSFFKEEVKLYGVKAPIVSKIAKRHFAQLKEMEKDGIFELCEQLWQSGYIEESFIACQWVYGIRSRFMPGDFQVLTRWVTQYVANWASCDTFCNHTVAAFVEMYPKHLAELKKWAKSRNRWVRRASAVTLIIPARNGRFLDDVFEIADLLLLDDDDLVQKGYGWMLKAASQSHQREVFDYVMGKKCSMPRTALRYAIEKMPAEMRQKAMVKNHTSQDRRERSMLRARQMYENGVQIQEIAAMFRYSRRGMTKLLQDCYAATGEKMPGGRSHRSQNKRAG
jgi:3-methyladenine DNA glycosylase AlkD